MSDGFDLLHRVFSVWSVWHLLIIGVTAWLLFRGRGNWPRNGSGGNGGRYA